MSFVFFTQQRATALSYAFQAEGWGRGKNAGPSICKPPFKEISHNLPYISLSISHSPKPKPRAHIQVKRCLRTTSLFQASKHPAKKSVGRGEGWNLIEKKKCWDKQLISATHGPGPHVPKTLPELWEGGRKAESAYSVIHQFQEVLVEIMLINNSNSGTTFSWKASLTTSPSGCRIDALFTSFYLPSCAVSITLFITDVIFLCFSFPHSLIPQLEGQNLNLYLFVSPLFLT